MTRLLEILISTAIVAVLFVLVALFLPSSRTITEQIETNRRQSIVFDTLNSLRRFGDWNALPMRDPGVSMELSGPESGVGARLDYESDERSLGSGSWEIIESDPDLIFLADTKCCGQSPESVAERPGWSEMTAVTGGDVVPLDEDVVQRWGPRVVDLLRDISEAASTVEANAA